MFLGVVGLAQDYKLLSKMIEYCNNKKYKCTFYFIGSGTKKTDLEKIVETPCIKALENWRVK